MQVNALTREVLVKIVYYGPGLGGKTTSLSCIHQVAPPETRGQIVSLATPVDRTLYFDFLPLRMAPVSDHHVRLQLFTVPGQVYFNATRKLVLTGADGVIFVADSQRGRQDANIESFENLVANLEEQGRDLDDMPLVIQFNKCDLDGIMPLEELEAMLNPKGVPSFSTCATSGEGVLPALDRLVLDVLDDLEARGHLGGRPSVAPEIVIGRTEEPLADRIGRVSEAITGVRRQKPPSVAAPSTEALIGGTEAAVEEHLGRAGEEVWKGAVQRAALETRSLGQSSVPSPSPAPSRISSNAPADSPLISSAAPPSFRAVESEPGRAAALARELSNLSFASLFPRRIDHALTLEGDLATGALRSAIERSDELATDLLAETARRAGLDAGASAATVALLLGVDGASWLWFRRLVERVREGGPVADRDALAAYALVIDLRLRSDRLL